MRTISQRDLRNDSGEILRAVEAGETMVVTKSGIPVAELRPLTRRRFVPAQEWLERRAGGPAVDPAEVRADVDAVYEQALDDPFDR